MHTRVEISPSLPVPKEDEELGMLRGIEEDGPDAIAAGRGDTGCTNSNGRGKTWHGSKGAQIHTMAATA